VVNESHRLAKRNKISVSELKNEHVLIRVENSSDLFLHVSELFAAFGVFPNIEARYTSSFIELLTNLQGAVFLWVLGCPVPGARGTRFSMVEIDGFHCPYGVWYRESSSNPALPLFLQEFSDAFHSKQVASR
jgi:hypothetical protein